MSLNNYHTHSLYCDGKDTLEEMIREAIRLGCEELGFSEHAFVPFDDCCMTPEATVRYKEELRGLRERYRGQIRILPGIEQDYFSPMPTDDYAYVIGSVHYIYRNGSYLAVDHTRAIQERIIREQYAGDPYAMVEDYFRLAGEVWEKTRCDIVGHFDLVTKFNENGDLFDTAHPRYRRAALAALEKLCEHPVIFEINNGAVVRGYRRMPYPEPWLLEELQRRKQPLILSTDCHDRRYLLYGMEELRRRFPQALEKLPLRAEKMQ